MPPGVTVTADNQLKNVWKFTRVGSNEIGNWNDEKMLRFLLTRRVHRQLALRNGHRLRLAVVRMNHLDSQMTIVLTNVSRAGERHGHRQCDINKTAVLVNSDDIIDARIDDDSGYENGARNRRIAHQRHWTIGFIVDDNLHLAHHLNRRIHNVQKVKQINQQILRRLNFTVKPIFTWWQ